MSARRRRTTNPVVLILIAIASVQFGAALAKGAFEHSSPLVLAFLRAGFASIVLLIIARPRLRSRSGTDWLLAAGYGLALSGMNLAIYFSYQRIPLGVAVTLEFVGPLALAVMGSRRLVDLLWVALAALGVVLLGTAPTGLDPLGVVLALLAGALWACYIALAGPLGKRWAGIEGLAVGSTLGALGLAVPMVIVAPAGLGDPRVLGAGLAVALLSSAIPFALELHARRTIKASTFAILMSLEPAAAAFFAWLVLGELLGSTEIAAMAAVVVASIGAVRTARRTKRGKETVGNAGA